MVAKGLGTRKAVKVKVLNKGEITKPLTVHAHASVASTHLTLPTAPDAATAVTS